MTSAYKVAMVTEHDFMYGYFLDSVYQWSSSRDRECLQY